MVSDGTKTQAGATLGAGKEGTPKETYSKEEVAKLVTDAKTSALADVGRLRAEAEKALTAATAAEERLNKMEQARIEAELEANKDDPAELRRIRAEQGKKLADDELAKVKRELGERTEKLTLYEAKNKEVALTDTVRDVATRLGVETEKLMKFAKLTDGSTEAIEDIARDLPKVTTARGGLRPDSNRSIGGNLTFEQARTAFIENPYDRGVKERYLEMLAQQR